MKWLRKALTSRFKKDQSGQSLTLLAIGFIALLGFTGLVTDISILFVRYSTLRRTVDSAAIAAAGQIREGTDYGVLAFTAREFIQLHGMTPHRVWVETCETDIHNWRNSTGPWVGQPTPDPGADVEEMGNTELCNWDNPRKLVRVTAQIESETFFLRILGIDGITLEASSVSETAVLDVALVLDTSQSMSQFTTLADYAGIGMNAYGTEPSKPAIRDNCYNADWRAEGRPAYVMEPKPAEDDPDSGVWVLGYNEDPTYYRWGACCNDPGNGKVHQLPDGTWEIYIDLNNNNGYDAGEPTGAITSNVGDGRFDDLICQPFRQVKDAARNFVRRLDYVRGDRVTLVTFNRTATIVPPEGKPEDTVELMMTNEGHALLTLDRYVGVNVNSNRDALGRLINFGRYNECSPATQIAYYDYIDDGVANDSTGSNPDFLEYFGYSSVAQCPDTNVGGGIRAANNALTNAATIRRDSVWVMILLSDGAANRTDPVDDRDIPTDYGFSGFCPWGTFCNPPAGHPNHNPSLPVYESECPAWTSGLTPPFCNDNDPNTRHFCLVWSTDEEKNGRPDWDNPSCGDPKVMNYDADDYARDWADFAGLININSEVAGNFIAIFTIGFGDDVANTNTGAPLLRYIADAGDNGIIDNDLEQDWRDDGSLNGSATPGEPDVCQGVADPKAWCGQYYFASDLDSLEAVFEAIASRLFTRLAR